jgi:hypothetical protein
MVRTVRRPVVATKVRLGHALHPAGDRGDGLVELGCVLAAGLGQVGPTAAAAAHHLGDVLHETTGREALHQVLRHRGHEAHLAVDRAAEEDDPRRQAIAQGVHHRAEPVRVEAVEARGQHRHPRHLSRGGDEVLGLGARELGLELGELLLEPLLVLQERGEPAGQLERRNLEQAGRLAQRRLLAPHVGERVLAGDRLDAAHPGGHRALVGHLEEADLPGGVEVGAAAELGREVADADDAHPVAVLLAEEGHRAGAQRLLQVHLGRAHHHVGLHLLVDQALDALDLAILDRRAVGEVESQMVRRHQRAGLADVRAEDFS